LGRSLWTPPTLEPSQSSTFFAHTLTARLEPRNSPSALGLPDCYLSIRNCREGRLGVKQYLQDLPQRMKRGIQGTMWPEKRRGDQTRALQAIWVGQSGPELALGGYPRRARSWSVVWPMLATSSADVMASG
jgi:hypothetical protein